MPLRRLREEVFNNDDDEELETTREKKMTIKERMVKAISSIGGKPKLDTNVYSSSLNIEELIDCIGEMENLFDFEKIRDP